MKKRVKRGQLYLADLSPVIDSEQGGVRPVLVIQNDRWDALMRRHLEESFRSQPKTAEQP